MASEQILKVECNISGTTNFMLSGILSASGILYYLTHLDPHLVFRHKNREKLAHSRSDSNLQSKVKALSPSRIPNSPYGALFVAG